MSQAIVFAVVHGHRDKSEFMLCGKACGLSFRRLLKASVTSGAMLAVAGGAHQVG